ncbi:2TM domain-containing protein [Chitinibacteraceae bacterium HSL-7]
MIIRQRRLEKGWSQQQLAELTGLSVRTVQRIERGQPAGLETARALASVLELDLSDIQSTTEGAAPMTQTQSTHHDDIIAQVRDIKGFYSHALTYAGVMLLLLLINALTSPSYWWVVWPALGWGIGLINHGLNVFEVFNLFGPKWEQRQIEKRLARRTAQREE